MESTSGADVVAENMHCDIGAQGMAVINRV